MSLTAHPGFTRALTAVRGAEIGLLRAVALDIVAVGEDTGGSADALTELGPVAIDMIRQLTGPAAVTLQAHATAGGGSTGFLGKTNRGIAVSAHLSVVVGDRREYLRAAIRLVGTHGSVLVDLLRPALDVRTAAGETRVPFAAPDDAVSKIEQYSAVLEAISASARSGQTVSITW